MNNELNINQGWKKLNELNVNNQIEQDRERYIAARLKESHATSGSARQTRRHSGIE